MNRITRRDLLRTAGAAGLSLPLLSSLAGRRAGAATASYPKRIIFLYMAQNETEDFTPVMSGGNLSLTGTYLEPLAPWAAKMLHVSNLTGTSGHYGGHSEWLTGWPNPGESWAPTQGPSLDQYLAARIGNATQLPTLGLTMAPIADLGDSYNVTSWTAANLAVPHFGSAHEAFAAVFGAGTGMTTPTQADTARRLKTSLLDALVGDYTRINSLLAAGDRPLLDAHLTLLRQLETKLQQQQPPPAATCTPPADPAESGNMWYPDWQVLVRDHIDVLVGALRCDITRVATLAFGGSGTIGPFSWDPVDVDDFHQVSHRNVPMPRPDHFRVRLWHSQQIAYLLQQLDATPEGSGTLLDHTVVCWLPELGYYPTTFGDNPHLRDQISVALIGSSSGTFKTNTMLDVGQAHYHNLLLTLGQAMGYPDLMSFGAMGTTPIGALLA
jgi:hypothetical protein